MTDYLTNYLIDYQTKPYYYTYILQIHLYTTNTPIILQIHLHDKPLYCKVIEMASLSSFEEQQDANLVPKGFFGNLRVITFNSDEDFLNFKKRHDCDKRRINYARIIELFNKDDAKNVGEYDKFVIKQVFNFTQISEQATMEFATDKSVIELYIPEFKSFNDDLIISECHGWISPGDIMKIWNIYTGLVDARGTTLSVKSLGKITKIIFDY